MLKQRGRPKGSTNKPKTIVTSFTPVVKEKVNTMPSIAFRAVVSYAPKLFDTYKNADGLCMDIGARTKEEALLFLRRNGVKVIELKTPYERKS